MNKLCIQALVDNVAHPEREGFATEAGLSYWIEIGEAAFLFDTGEGEAIQKNAPLLGRDMNEIDGIVLSHGHHDHTNGMGWVVDQLDKDVPVYAKGSVAEPIWSDRASGIAYAGVQKEWIPLIQARLHPIEKVEEIAPGFFLIPQASRIYPQPGSSIFLLQGQEGHLEADAFAHECFAVFEREEGIVVLSGCSHQGIANMVDKAMELFPGQPVLSVIGGFHLQGREPDFEESTETIDGVAHMLKEHVQGIVHTGHCTSLPGFERLKVTLGDQVQYFHIGDILRF